MAQYGRGPIGPSIDDVRLTRRDFARGGLAAGLLWAAPGQAQQRAPTAESPMGPFYPVERPTDVDADLTAVTGRSGRAQGTVIEVRGRVLDMRGRPIQGATVELWQANAAGRYDHPADPATAPLDPGFQGFARLTTGADGAWRITTVKPGGYDSPIGHRPPHIHFDIIGSRHRNIAQLYFPEEAGNAADTLYRALGDQAASSVAVRDAANPNLYSWDVVLMEG
jgi:protocatechuate 3,4-dioxygenase beta subunit